MKRKNGNLKPKKKMKTWKKVVLTIVLVILSLIVLAVAAAAVYIGSLYSKISGEDIPIVEREEEYVMPDEPEEGIEEIIEGEETEPAETDENGEDALDSQITEFEENQQQNEVPAAPIYKREPLSSDIVNVLLLGRDAAIVTDIEGTTRDVLSEKIPLGRVMLNLSDTAGVRNKTSDPIEKIGIQRSRERIADAELILAVFDLSREFDSEDEALISELSGINATKIALLNKADLKQKFDRTFINNNFGSVIEISAENGADNAVQALAQIVDKLFTDEKILVGQEAIIASARQNAELCRALTLTESAIEAYRLGISQDAASSDIELALGAIAELDGLAVSESVVADIFSKFCVGK